MLASSIPIARRRIKKLMKNINTPARRKNKIKEKKC